MKLFTHGLLAATLTAAAALAQAQTAPEAKALLDAALAEVKAKGLDGAVKEFNAGGKWVKGPMYIVVANFEGQMLAHSANDKIPGKNMLGAKGADGTEFVKATIASVKSTGSGEISFRWGNPATKQIGDAVMFSRRVPGSDTYVGTVIFK